MSAINDTPTGDLTIEGAATQGRVLKAFGSLPDADGLCLLTYQCNASGHPRSHKSKCALTGVKVDQAG